MSTNDLFSFLEETNADGAESSTNGLQLASTSMSAKAKKKKRKQQAAQDAQQLLEANGGSEPELKRARMDVDEPVTSLHPIVLDEFETEAKREVTASAGLTGGVVEDQRLELRHQVSFYISSIRKDRYVP